MKANELMLGDFIFCKSISKPARVEGISMRESSGPDGYTFILRDENNTALYVRAVSVSPIPLTPEILEKNGIKQGSGWESRWFDTIIEDKRITLRQDNTCWVVMVNMGYFPMLNNIDIHYVHELQHALRLCGINKTIEL